jgi:ammonia channel protein AmtB
MLSVGIFVDIDPVEDTTEGQRGLLHGGGFRLLGIQALACVAIIAWSAVTSFILLFVSVERVLAESMFKVQAAHIKKLVNYITILQLKLKLLKQSNRRLGRKS